MNKALYWAPRVLGVLFIIFITLFSFDVFGTGLGFWQAIGAFLIHSIPSFILAIILFIAWKKEIIGGAIFLALGLFCFFWSKQALSFRLLLGLAPALIGALFIIQNRLRK